MHQTPLLVTTAQELSTALAAPSVQHLQVQGHLRGLMGFRLRPGQTLSGDPSAVLEFASGQAGVQLSADNQIEGLVLKTDVDRLAIHTDATQPTWGTLALRELQVQGVVQLVARGNIRSGHVQVEGLHISAADARALEDHPIGYGVEVLQGAFTLWNQQAETTVHITADLMDLSAGLPGAPVRGSGIFVSGAGDVGGRLVVSRLQTGPVYSDGGIRAGTPDRITGAVFTVYGAYVDQVRNTGPVVTYGANDMVLDNWGTVDEWVAEQKISSYGPSGIGFVNFGVTRTLQVLAPIETFGQGARAFNVYAGTVGRAEFERLVTHADGAVGLQISQPVGHIHIRRGIETFGAEGDSLVKGVVMRLSAIGLSIKPGGSARSISVQGGVTCHQPGVQALDLQGPVASLRIES